MALTAPPACVRVPRQTASAPHDISRPPRAETPAVALNRASRAELEKLPGLGPALAARVVEHRERHGPFRRVEHLLLIRGFGEQRLRDLRPYLTLE